MPNQTGPNQTGPDATGPDATGPNYRERLWPAPWVFISTALVIPASLLVFLSISTTPGIVCAIVLSAAIASSSGAKSAEAVALAKQLHDARFGGGFSFAAWCADLAGIALAERVQRDQPPLAELARTFRIE